MNLTPRNLTETPAKGRPQVRGSVRLVWLFLKDVAFKTSPPTKRFQVSRREIKEGTGIGSLNTIDDALATLEAYSLLARYAEPGSNDGDQYELLTLDENPAPVIDIKVTVNTLRQLADSLEQEGARLTYEQLGQFSILALKARRILSDSR